MKNAQAEDMNIIELMQTYSPVYPGSSPTWDDTIKYLLNSPPDKAILDHLMAILQSGQSFREPVRLETMSSRECCQKCDPGKSSTEDLEPLLLLDGTHRVCATFLVSKETISVIHDPQESVEWGSDAEYLIATTYLAYEQDGLNEDQVDELSDFFRSFPLDDNVWVTSSSASFDKTMMEISWDFEVTPETELLYPAIDAHINDLLQKRGFTFRAKTATASY